MIYLDHHATTPCDQRVVDAMLPWLTQSFGNPHSTSHSAGRVAADVVARSAACVARHLGCPAESILWTSGATESNNLAIRGICGHPRQKRRHLITCFTEHHAVLDVVAEIEQNGWRVTRVPAYPQDHELAGCVDLDALAGAIDEDTALVSVMWANNEIGTISPMQQIAHLCHQAGALLHSDATQAVGRLPVDMKSVDVDLLSASAHKFYGPKGIGILVVGNGNRRVRLRPQIVGGGQQRNLRSGTLAPASIVALTTALEIAVSEMSESDARIRQLRKVFCGKLLECIEGLVLNGISLESPQRLAGNLNVRLPDVEGESWMAAAPDVCFSSGSACSSVDANPSHVLTGIGLTESEARRSVRFGIGKFTTDEEITQAVRLLCDAYRRIKPA
ncbi:Cysteine desulfurase [Stieleria varia]|uniref:cysteine desulfurase n=2 Tax=Stieleria varia TaxID=2528005 RepID=A0A5C6AU00_9BACT|nr:Cysteine desulfurase [Stieleria varia]